MPMLTPAAAIMRLFMYSPVSPQLPRSTSAFTPDRLPAERPAGKEQTDRTSAVIDTLSCMTQSGDRRETHLRGDPSTHQLRLFLLLAEELHFGRAARRAFMTQPAFSRQIRSLERRLELTLVARDTRTAGLTEAGQATACTFSL
jgi:hypothetical protein